MILVESNRLHSRLQLEAISSSLTSATMTTTTTAIPMFVTQSVSPTPPHPSFKAKSAFMELELKHGTLDDFFNHDPGGLNTWEEFLSFLHNKILWTDYDVFVALRTGRAPVIESEYYRPILSLDTSYSGPKLDIYAPIHSYIKNTLEGLLLLLSVSKVSHLELISPHDENVPLPCGAAFLEYFLTQNLHVARLGMERLSLTPSQCQTLATHITPETLTLDLVLTNCRLQDDGASISQLVHQSQKYPTMGLCFSRTPLGKTAFHNICNGLPTSKSLQSLQLIYMDLPDSQMKLLVRSLSQNTSLAWIDLRGNDIRDPTWQAFCEALHRKPRIKYIGLANTAAHDSIYGAMTPSRKRFRTNLLLQMIRSNLDLYSVHVSMREHDDLLLEEMDELLLIHRHRPRALALTQVYDSRMRAAVLVKALSSVRFAPNLLWTFLQENIDVLIQYGSCSGDDKESKKVTVASC